MHILYKINFYIVSSYLESITITNDKYVNVE